MQWFCYVGFQPTAYPFTGLANFLTHLVDALSFALARVEAIGILSHSVSVCSAVEGGGGSKCALFSDLFVFIAESKCLVGVLPGISSESLGTFLTPF